MSVFVPQTLNDSDDQRFSRLGRRSTMRRKVSMLVTINEDGAITTRSGASLNNLEAKETLRSDTAM
uniref:Uncharacterized protein n=1 Tax=Ascaris lumbricoides TaxID=6252 RepID=A0A0M3HUV4_ASCLU